MKPAGAITSLMRATSGKPAVGGISDLSTLLCASRVLALTLLCASASQGRGAGGVGPSEQAVDCGEPRSWNLASSVAFMRM
mmetsp:Transcript_69030/g.186526  ORF Transcript_69030/g.186526 Transcript_69030/m.186526 type:complete len:81 (+) Transcript_69030:94-336(+)